MKLSRSQKIASNWDYFRIGKESLETAMIEAGIDEIDCETAECNDE